MHQGRWMLLEESSLSRFDIILLFRINKFMRQRSISYVMDPMVTYAMYFRKEK